MIAPPISPPMWAPIETLEMKNLSITRLKSSSGPKPVSQKRTPRRTITTVAAAPTPNTAPDAPPLGDERVEDHRAERAREQRREVDRREAPRPDRGFEHLPDQVEDEHVEEDVQDAEVHEAGGDEPPPLAVVAIDGPYSTNRSIRRLPLVV